MRLLTELAIENLQILQNEVLLRPWHPRPSPSVPSPNAAVGQVALSATHIKRRSVAPVAAILTPLSTELPH